MARKHFGGIYTSTRTINAGDRVVGRIKIGWRGITRYGDARPAYGERLGTVVNVTKDPLAGRCATVRWDDDGEQLCLTSDLKKVQ